MIELIKATLGATFKAGLDSCAIDFNSSVLFVFVTIIEKNDIWVFNTERKFYMIVYRVHGFLISFQMILVVGRFLDESCELFFCTKILLIVYHL
ncbi:hypothetical protein AYR55_10715 [Loigolactobacillus backii]|nr:hypothetical protein AYR55_10715 [Loigolactobacillus backii]